MPTAEQWKAKLARAMDPSGALSDGGVRTAQVECVLGTQLAIEAKITPAPRPLAEGLVDSLPGRLADGVLDSVFLGRRQLGDVAQELNKESGAGFTDQCGGAKPLLEKLMAYVRAHPFPEPAAGLGEASPSPK